MSVLASLSGGEASAAVTELERKIEETVRDEEERLQQRHPALLGPFAAQAEQLRASAVLARRKLAEKAARGVVGSALLRAPRRALLNDEDNTTEIILIAIFVLIVDFFFGFYTGEAIAPPFILYGAACGSTWLTRRNPSRLPQGLLHLESSREIPGLCHCYLTNGCTVQLVSTHHARVGVSCVS